MERSALFRTYGTKGFRNWSCSGPLECDEVEAVHKYKYVYCIYVQYSVYNIHLEDMHVEATTAGRRSFSFLICAASLLYTCSTQVCLAWLVLLH